MARHWFGDQTADVVVAPGEQVEVDALLGYTAVLAPAVALHLYDFDTGDRVTDLMDATGGAISSIVTGPTGRIPRFRGPDGVERLSIGQDPATLPVDADPTTHQWTILTTSYPDIVSGLRDRVAALEAESGGEYTSSPHPVFWTAAGPVEAHTSDHRPANLDGRAWVVTAVRASAMLAADSTLTVTVSTVDLDTGALTPVQTLTLTSAAPAATVLAPEWEVPAGVGLTVGVAIGAGGAQNLTVQVMVR